MIFLVFLGKILIRIQGSWKIANLYPDGPQFWAKLSNLVGFYHEKNWEWTAGIFAQLVPDLLFGYCMLFSGILKIYNV